MATQHRRIEPKPSNNITENLPLLLVPLNSQSTVAITTQIVPQRIVIDARSLQSNLESRQEAVGSKLAHRPAQGYLIQQGTLQAEGVSSSHGILRSKERDALKRKIEQRPSKQKLVTQHILLTASNADPIIQRKAEVLKRCKLKDDLNKKLQHRPGPLELVTKKILQADVELEQAIQEGRLLFTKTTGDGDYSSDGSECSRNGMEVLSAAPICPHQRKHPNVCSSKPKARKKTSQCRTPYDQSPLSPTARSKLKLQDSSLTSDLQISEKSNDSITSRSTPCLGDDAAMVVEQSGSPREVQSSYDLLLQQQQLFLQWQREVEESRALGALQDDDRRQQYRGDECKSLPAMPPCMASSASCGGVRTECAVSMQQVREQQDQQSCCQCSSSTVADSTTSTAEVEKPKSRLSDYRVQDLKNECKKRQLPVSGAKPQLLERLRPYEDSILNASTCSAYCLSEPVAAVELVAIPSPTSESLVTAQSSRLPPISNVIGDCIQKQNFSQRTSPLVQPQQPQQHHPIMMQLPPAQQHQHQILHLVDSNGAVVATATVPTNVQCCCMSSEHPLATNITFNSVSGERQRCDRVIQQQQTATVQMAQVGSQVAQQVQAEPTFSFAQLGSGGQFTLVQTPLSSDQQQQQTSSHLIQTSQGAQQQLNGQLIQTASGTIHSAAGSQISHSSCQARSSTPTDTARSTPQHVSSTSIRVLSQPQIVHTPASVTSCHSVKQQNPCSTQYVICNDNKHQIQQNGAPVSQNALCPPMQSALPHCSPVMADSASGSSPDVPSPPANSDKIAPQGDSHSGPVDPNDTNALLSATTLSIHEEMLRFQQRKIEELQKELHRSQQQLKHQQQVILAAKKAQQAKRQEDARQEGSHEQSEADVWLSQLDIKHLNKFHIQLFLQHKLQQQQMQTQIMEQQNLTTTEQKLQEELHVEQAVQDIVRLIKQDARTALLIVQLLRRYQLERSQAVAAATQVNDEQKHCELEGQQRQDRASVAQVQNQMCTPQCCIQAETPMDTSQLASQQKTNIAVNNDDDMSVTGRTLSSHPALTSKPKIKKKNNASRSASTKSEGGDLQEKSSATVDMEEIFRKVLENASKALASDAPKKRSVCMETPPPILGEFQIQQSPSEACNQQGCANISDPSASKAMTLPGCEQLMRPYMAKPVLNGSFVGNEQQQTIAEISDPRFGGRVEVLEEGAVASVQPYHYSKNQAFDDLMDVLRDDQAEMGEVRANEVEFGSGTVYGSDELATLFGDNWFQRDCAMQVTPIYTQQNGQFLVESTDFTNEKVDVVDQAASPNTEAFSRSDSEQNIGMDWLEMMLPSPAHTDMDTAVVDPM